MTWFWNSEWPGFGIQNGLGVGFRMAWIWNSEWPGFGMQNGPGMKFRMAKVRHSQNVEDEWDMHEKTVQLRLPSLFISSGLKQMRRSVGMQLEPKFGSFGGCERERHPTDRTNRL